jgi:hypothetical protein
MNSLQKVFIVFILALFLLPVSSYSQEAEKEQSGKIPEEVAKAMDANLPARQARLDIPLSFVNTLYFPYQSDYFTCFFLRMKNKDLGYVAPFGEEKKEAKKEVEEEEQILSCNVDFFFRIYSLGKNGELKDLHKEIYLPYADQTVSKEFNPEEENIYSFGTIFPPGRYLLSAAAASLDLSKIGLIFQEFHLPSPSNFRRNLGLTPLFFIKSIKRMPAPDSAINIYKNFFHYSTLEIEPYFDRRFSPAEKLDIFYIILGGTPDESSRFSFEITYTYKKGEEEVVKFEPQVLDNIPAPVVSIPLPLLFKETKLDPGEYILEIAIKDKIGRKEAKETVNFVMK